MTLLRRLNHMRGLTLQFLASRLRVVYAASGTLPAAAVLEVNGAIVEHANYWCPARTSGEAHYLAAIINSERTRRLVKNVQPKGQGGARHFDNLIWELPIPEYDPASAYTAISPPLAPTPSRSRPRFPLMAPPTSPVSAAPSAMP